LALKEEILDYFKCKSMGHFCRFDCEKLRICLLSKVIPYLKRKQTVFFHIDNGFVWDEQTLHNYVPPCFTVVEMHLLLYFSPCNSCFIVIHHHTQLPIFCQILHSAFVDFLRPQWLFRKCILFSWPIICVKDN